MQDLLPTDLFKGQTVFITGGGSGINFGVAEAFARHGASVAICGRTREKLDKACENLEKLGAKTFAETADVRDYDALASAVEGAGKALGRVSHLVCGAAGNFLAPAENLSAGGFKAVVDIDLIGSFNASRAAFAQLREGGGSILFISAGQAFVPYFAQAHAGAAKAGVDNLMQNLALEWGRFGIRSNSVAPGPIEGTEGMARLAPGDEKFHSRFRASIPIGRYGTTDDIGQAAVFLASPMASFVTGTRLVVDGGMNLQGSGLLTSLVMSAGRSQAGNT
ncbi:MAG: NAD(P)-dependent dehydrogenase (short-subunit alcohol dehydrogenase family) [Rhodothermales bacterium]|jgi:NAD(P)-dependent dehydrogenase (short-subunit alcohol dehydrogenase family)